MTVKYFFEKLPSKSNSDDFLLGKTRVDPLVQCQKLNRLQIAQNSTPEGKLTVSYTDVMIFLCHGGHQITKNGE